MVEAYRRAARTRASFRTGSCWRWRRAGGRRDKRGKQSAAILVAGREPRGYHNLRVDDHPDPVGELRVSTTWSFSTPEDRARVRPGRPATLQSSEVLTLTSTAHKQRPGVDAAPALFRVLVEQQGGAGSRPPRRAHAPRPRLRGRSLPAAGRFLAGRRSQADREVLVRQVNGETGTEVAVDHARSFKRNCSCRVAVLHVLQHLELAQSHRLPRAMASRAGSGVIEITLCTSFIARPSPIPPTWRRSFPLPPAPVGHAPGRPPRADEVAQPASSAPTTPRSRAPRAGGSRDVAHGRRWHGCGPGPWSWC